MTTFNAVATRRPSASARRRLAATQLGGAPTARQSMEATLESMLGSASCEPLTRAGEQAIAAEYAATGSPQAAERLICSNMRYFYGMARRHDRPDSTLEVADLFSEAVAVAYDRLPMYDAAKAGFMTFIEPWLRLTMAKAHSNSDRPVRVPVERASQVRKLAATAAALADHLERSPTDAELAGALGWSSVTLATIRDAMATGTSINQPAPGDTETHTLEDRLAAPSTAAVEQSTVLTTARATLAAREWAVLVMHLGLDGSAPRTFAEIATHIPRRRSASDRAGHRVARGAPVTREITRRLKDEAVATLQGAPTLQLSEVRTED